MTPFIIHNEASRAHAAKAIAELSDKKRWKVEVKLDRPRRTKSQNALMWMWIDEAVQALHNETGQDKDDIHEYFKRKFCPIRMITVGDEQIAIKSTKKLSIEQMRIYMNAIEGYCASEWGIILPIPEEMHRHD